MTNNSNIYDIDGQLLRAAGDDHEITVEEAQAKIKEYEDKLAQLPDNEDNALKMGVYKTYIRNLQSYVFNYYMKHPESLPISKYSTKEEIEKAMEELKKDTEEDEYVPYEEVKDEQEGA